MAHGRVFGYALCGLFTKSLRCLLVEISGRPDQRSTTQHEPAQTSTIICICRDRISPLTNGHSRSQSDSSRLEFRWHDPRASPLSGGVYDPAPAPGHTRPHDPAPALSAPPCALARSFCPAARTRATPQSPDRGGNCQERGGALAEFGGRRGGRGRRWGRGQKGEASKEHQDLAVAAAPRHRGIWRRKLKTTIRGVPRSTHGPSTIPPLKNLQTAPRTPGIRDFPRALRACGFDGEVGGTSGRERLTRVLLFAARLCLHQPPDVRPPLCDSHFCLLSRRIRVRRKRKIRLF